jgi:RNA-directed DNA polymerase
MRRLVLGWKMLGLERSLGSRIVTYADDLVILCRRGKGEEALARMRHLMGKLKLTVNEEKTRSFKVPEGEFNFLATPWLRWVRQRPVALRLARPVMFQQRTPTNDSVRSRPIKSDPGTA